MRRPDLLAAATLSPADQSLLEAFRRDYAAALDEPSDDA